MDRYAEVFVLSLLTQILSQVFQCYFCLLDCLIYMAVPWKIWLKLHTKVFSLVFVLQDMALQCIIHRNCLFYLEILIALLLSWWKAIPHFLSYAANLLRSSCNMALSCCFWILLYSKQSSARRCVLDWTQSGKSLINMKIAMGLGLFHCDCYVFWTYPAMWDTSRYLPTISSLNSGLFDLFDHWYIRNCYQIFNISIRRVEK